MSGRSIRYAHSFPGRPPEDWETLQHHLVAVAKYASRFAETFGWGDIARVAAMLHDIGKCSDEFFDYIRRSAASEERLRGPDHSTAGARIAKQLYPTGLGTMLAYVIAGHHCGLADWVDLERRLGPDYKIPAYAAWRDFVGPLAPASALGPTLRPKISKKWPGFSQAFLIRMLFSALVDADSLATEEVYAEDAGRTAERGEHTDLATLRDRLHAFMAAKQADAAAKQPGKLNELRADVLRHAVAKSEDAPGLFTLTVPTGGGKTLASLAFALEHAIRHGLRRIVYVIPYTSIIEQTADVFRCALATGDDILEHHANFDWDRDLDQLRPDEEGSETLKRLRLASENWDVPIVVTTAVQFYESLFSNRRARCRKLHNLAKSVVVLDEAHTMPLKLLLPAMAAVEDLAANYGSSVVLCTATQPALRAMDGFEDGFDIDETREVAPDPERLFHELDRFDIEWQPQEVSDDEIVARFGAVGQMLCVVNTRAHARALFQRIDKLEGAVHLSTLMCPRHRRKVLAGIRQRLNDGKPVRLVSTSLIECGVDISFPEVWRASTGLDSILQAGGRCNRENGPVRGRLVVFEPLGRAIPAEMKTFWDAAREVSRNATLHANSLEQIRTYFGRVYWGKGRDALDAAEVAGYRGILAAIAENKSEATFAFASIADAFEMIEDEKESVVVPWRDGETDREADELLARIGAMEKPRRGDLQKLQQYVVGISPRVRGTWLALRVLVPLHEQLGTRLLKFADLHRYDPNTGLNLGDPELLPTALGVWDFRS